jgi:hypothetical protein
VRFTVILSGWSVLPPRDSKRDFVLDRTLHTSTARRDDLSTSLASRSTTEFILSTTRYSLAPSRLQEVPGVLALCSITTMDDSPTQCGRQDAMVMAHKGNVLVSFAMRAS